MKRPGCSSCERLSLEGATGDGSAGNCVAPVELAGRIAIVARVNGGAMLWVVMERGT